jgi:hypothetical protein
MNLIQHNNQFNTFLNPFWMSGFIDGEGCFSISFSLRQKMKWGLEIRPSFSVTQKNDKNLINLELFKQIPLFFKCGYLRFNKQDNMCLYETRNLTDIQKNIIPFFRKYPLQTSKKNDFDKFVIICNKLSQGLHLNKSGLCEIIEIAYTMNTSGKKKFSQEYLLKCIDKVKV